MVSSAASPSMTKPRGQLVLLLLLSFETQTSHALSDEQQHGVLADKDATLMAGKSFMLWERAEDYEAEVDEVTGEPITPCGQRMEPPPHLQDLHMECLELASGNVSQFPEFNKDHCENSVLDLKVQVCAGSTDQRIQNFISTMMEKFTDEMAIIRSDGPADVYLKCGELVADEENRDADEEDADEEGNDEGLDCGSCVEGRHRGGVTRFQVTSHACAWNPADEGSCEAYAPLLVSSADNCDNARTGSVSRAPPTQKALLIAFNYPGTPSQLGGTIPDIINVYTHLVEEMKFNEYDITVIVDVPRYESFGHPKKQWERKSISEWFDGSNLILRGKCGVSDVDSALTSVISTLKSGDFFVFHYSGHGTYQRDRAGDELDGLDEVIALPNGEMYVDDNFYKHLRQIPAGVKAFVMVDACHSEGFSDLPFNYQPGPQSWCLDWAKPNKLPMAEITYVSGSQNHQTSGDLGMGGALSTHAQAKWTRGRTSMHRSMATVERELTTQDPSLSAWPTFRDTAVFLPWNRNEQPTRDAARSDASAGGSHILTVPNACTHGGVNTSRISHGRKQQGRNFKYDRSLNDASSNLAPGLVQGCTDCSPVVQEPQMPLVPQHGAYEPPKCECAGDSPWKNYLGKRCTYGLPSGKTIDTLWCYVKGTSARNNPCKDFQHSTSGDKFNLGVSEIACQTGASGGGGAGQNSFVSPLPQQPSSHGFGLGQSGFPALPQHLLVPQQGAYEPPKCECAGDSPWKNYLGERCTYGLPSGGTMRKQWCYVKGRSARNNPCKDFQYSTPGDKFSLGISEDACKGRSAASPLLAGGEDGDGGVLNDKNVTVGFADCPPDIGECLPVSPITKKKLTKGCSDKAPGKILGRNGREYIEGMQGQGLKKWCYVKYRADAADSIGADAAKKPHCAISRQLKSGKTYTISFKPCA